MVTFNCRVTKKGNLRLTRQAREILALVPNDLVTVTVDCEASDELRIPQEFLDEAGISEDSRLEVYADNGRVIVQEVCDD